MSDSGISDGSERSISEILNGSERFSSRNI
jgi:hypothetical protein